jgi:hypothetical protein
MSSENRKSIWFIILASRRDTVEFASGELEVRSAKAGRLLKAVTIPIAITACLKKLFMAIAS